MDDRLGLGREDGRVYGARVEQVESDRLGAERPQAFVVADGPERADHLVAAVEQLGDESRADGAAGAGYEDSHGVCSFVV